MSDKCSQSAHMIIDTTVPSDCQILKLVEDRIVAFSMSVISIGAQPVSRIPSEGNQSVSLLKMMVL